MELKLPPTIKTLLRIATVSLFSTSMVVSVYSQSKAKVQSPVKFEIVKSLRLGTSQYPLEKLYVVIAEENFNRDSLRGLFVFLSMERPGVPLSILVFTDKDTLSREIEWEHLGVPYFPSTPEGNAARDKYFADYAPNDTGHLRASYFRNALSEYFYYSVSKDTDEMIIVDMKKAATSVP